METRVSIIVPVFNRGECAAVLVDSLRCQRFAAWEAILIDDGSAPEHREQWLAAIAGDERMVYRQRDREPKGAPTCRNIGLGAARGDLVIFLDCDDALGDETCLEERVAAMDADASLDFVVSPTRLFREQPGDGRTYHNRRVASPDLDELLRRDNPWQTTGPTWRRSFLERLGEWDEALPGWQDWDFNVRALCLGPNYRRIDGGMSWWRVGHGSTISTRLNETVYIRSVKAMLLATSARLERAGLLTERRRRLCGMLLITQAMGLAKRGLTTEARGMMDAAVENRLMERRVARLLWVYVLASRLPLMSKAVELALRTCGVPGDYFVPWFLRQGRVPVEKFGGWADEATN